MYNMKIEFTGKRGLDIGDEIGLLSWNNIDSDMDRLVNEWTHKGACWIIDNAYTVYNVKRIYELFEEGVFCFGEWDCETLALLKNPLETLYNWIEYDNGPITENDDGLICLIKDAVDAIGDELD